MPPTPTSAKVAGMFELLMLGNIIWFIVFVAYAFQLIGAVNRISKELQMVKNDLQTSKTYLHRITHAAEKVATFTDRYPVDQPAE